MDWAFLICLDKFNHLQSVLCAYIVWCPLLNKSGRRLMVEICVNDMQLFFIYRC